MLSSGEGPCGNPRTYRTITCPPRTILRQYNFGGDREDLLEETVAGGAGCGRPGTLAVVLPWADLGGAVIESPV